MNDTVDGRNPKQPSDMYERNPVKSWDIYHVNWLAGFFPSTVSFIFCQVKMVFPLGPLEFLWMFFSFPEAELEYRKVTPEFPRYS